MSEFDRYNTLDDLDKGDELERYLGEERVPRHVDPLRLWEVNNERYPVPWHLAFDALAATASSSGDEHVFSMAGLMPDDEHFNTKSDLAEAQQCLKSCEAAGLYREALENQRPCAADRSIEGASPLPGFEDVTSAPIGHLCCVAAAVEGVEVRGAEAGGAEGPRVRSFC